MIPKVCQQCQCAFELPISNSELAGFVKFCPICTEEKEAADRAAKPTKVALPDDFRRHCPPLYLDTDPARLPQDKLSKVLQWQFNKRGLLIKGDSGKGKTRAAWLLVKRLLSEGRTIETFDAIDFDLECSDRFLRGEGRAWITHLSRLDIVFFDDLGKSKLTDRVESTLFGLFEKRIANHLPVIVTTNDTGETMTERMSTNRGGPFVRRLREFCDTVNF